MFCRNCGKRTPDGQMICNECARTQVQPPQQEEPFEELNNSGRRQPTGAPVYQPYQQPVYQQPYQQPMQYGNRKEGFGKALAATILSNVGFVIAYIAFLLMIIAADYAYDYELASETAAPALMFALVSIGMGIASIVLGKQSIGVFNEAKNANRVRPVATLILGIIGLATGILTVVMGGLCTLLAVMFI